MDMEPLPGALRKACKGHVTALATRGTPQDKERNVMGHPMCVLTQKKGEALDWAGVGFWVPIGWDLVLPGGAAADSASSGAHSRSSIGPTVDGSRHWLPDVPSLHCPLGVANEEEFPKGRKGLGVPCNGSI